METIRLYEMLEALALNVSVARLLEALLNANTRAEHSTRPLNRLDSLE